MDSAMPHPRKELKEILREEREILHDDRDILHELEEVEHEINHPTLTHIKIQFSKGNTMATPVAGPITLTTIGQTATASIIGYDQFGNVFEGNFPNPTFTASDTDGKIATFNSTSGLITAVGNGVDNITATLTTTDEKGNPITLSDTETVTVALAVVPPVLTTIKVAFAQ
jgi:hypothetical protein